MKNVLVGQSGGPTAVINASLYGVIKESMDQPAMGEVYGMLNGIEGFINGHTVCLSQLLSNNELELLKATPAAFLGSCRYKLPENLEDPIYPLLFEKFEEMDIGWVFYIGGNDSMDTVAKLSGYAAKVGSDIRLIGIPKTIDNDLVLTDHTPGYGSAAKFVATAVRDICMDSQVYNTTSVTIVEIMGRNAGWLTAASVLARLYPGANPALIYLPEVPFSVDGFFRDIEAEMEKRGNVVVCVSEGVRDDNNILLCEYAQQIAEDTFGHKNLTGCGKQLENMIRAKYGVKTRSVELNVTQRCMASLVSETDLTEAVAAGVHGVNAALNGETGKMIACHRAEENIYQLGYQCVDVSLVCNQEKAFPKEWIIGRNNDISEEFIDYAMPLIAGELPRLMRDGLPAYCCLDTKTLRLR